MTSLITTYLLSLAPANTFMDTPWLLLVFFFFLERGLSHPQGSEGKEGGIERGLIE